MIRKILKHTIKLYLKFWAKTALRIHKPVIIAIAGTTNKTFTKEAVMESLERIGVVARGGANGFNTEFGLPLAILQLPSGYGEASAWWPAMAKAPMAALSRTFPGYLVLELGVSRPGDMGYLLSIVKPHVSILTNLTQRYLESFDDIDSFAAEFGMLAEATDRDGLVAVNGDVSRLLGLAGRSKAKFMTFGFNKAADICANFEASLEPGRCVIVSRGGNIEPACLLRPGNHHVYAYLAGRLVEDFFQKDESKKNPQKD